MKKVYALKAGDKRRLPPELSVDISNSEAEIVIEKMMQPSVAEFVHNPGADHGNVISPKADHGNVISSPGGRPRKRDGQQHPSTIPLVKEQYPPVAAGATPVQMSLINQKMLEECFESEASISDWLERFGFKRKKISEIIEEYGLYSILPAVLYVKDSIKKKKLKGTITGYLLSTLSGGWYLPNLS